MNNTSILQLLVIATHLIYPSDRETSITPFIIHMIKTAPESHWGKNVPLQSPPKEIKTEALAWVPMNKTYDVFWSSTGNSCSIEKGISYIHRYTRDIKDKNIALITTNIWVAGREKIKRFETSYGITAKHDDNECLPDFKADYIDKRTTCYYWDSKPNIRRYTLLTYIPFVQFIKEMETKN